ncbi:MAG: type II secretion system protein N [Candidatus Parcubacteria bacterium]|nr:type II secretion system protein N [Burkholderiales bacterium]
MTIPASLVARAIERSSNQLLLLRDPAGTAWAGSGILYARLRSGDLLDLGRLGWETSASGLFAGHLDADVALGIGASATRVELSLAGMNVRGLNLALPGRILAEFAPALVAFGPEGKLLLRSESLRIEDGKILGIGEIEWRDVRLTRVSEIGLGSHVARLRGGGDTVDLAFGTISGLLRLSGGGSWTRKSGLEVFGTAEHDADQASTLARLLQGICSEYKSGHCSFRYQQRQAGAG